MRLTTSGLIIRTTHKLRTFINTLSNVERVDVLPYHDLGVYKWEQLGIPYTLTNVKLPTEESILRARSILTD